MKKVIIIYILLSVTNILKAQFDAQFSQYWACKTYYNPASAGETQGINATLNHRQQWLGLSGAPKSSFIGIDFPLNKFGKNHGVGINIFNDNIGLFSNSSVLLDYAYKLKLSDGLLSIGTQFGIINQSFNGSKINISGGTLSPIHVSDDPAIPTTNVQAMSFDMGLGVFYSNKKGYAGLSFTHLFQPTISLSETSSIYVGRQMYFMSGLNHALEGSQIILRPSMLLKSDFRTMVLDLTMRADFNQKIWGGLTYRWNNAMVAAIGVKLKDISVGYSYDISTTKLFNTTYGSHELSLCYNFDLVIQNKSKRKINKSPRYL